MVKLNMKKIATTLLLFGFAATAIASQEQSDDDWGDDWGDDEQQTAVSPWQTHGFINYSYGDFIHHNPLFNPSDKTLHELRGQLNLKYNHDKFTIDSKSDLVYDNVLKSLDFKQRQLSLSTKLSEQLDIKLGRQILTWGTGDYLFLNDLFPKDWQSFFAGREDAYLKAPSDSIKLSYYINDVAINLAWTPEFTPDNYLTGERFSFYSPLAQSNIAPAQHFVVQHEDNEQLSTRIKWQHQGVEYAIYGYKGFWSTPQGITAQGIPYFPKMNSLGASFITPASKGILKGEFSHYNSAAALDQTRYLIGYEQEVIKNLTASGQFYVEQNRHHDLIAKDHYRTLLTLRLNYLVDQQTYNYQLFVFYSPSDKDAYIRPQIRYRHNDQWSISIGANLFTGKHHYSFFGQHEENSNAWITVKRQF